MGRLQDPGARELFEHLSSRRHEVHTKITTLGNYLFNKTSTGRRLLKERQAQDEKRGKRHRDGNTHNLGHPLPARRHRLLMTDVAQTKRRRSRGVSPDVSVPFIPRPILAQVLTWLLRLCHRPFAFFVRFRDGLPTSCPSCILRASVMSRRPT